MKSANNNKGGMIMYRIRPYSSNVQRKDVFDFMDDFFNTPVRSNFVRNFKVDVEELKDKYIVDVEVPGLNKEDINITYENEYLTIRISKEEDQSEEKKEYVLKERSSFTSERSFYLKDVDPNNVKAALDNGVLTITLNKMESAVNSYLIDIE
jgi:HSP20 family protein